MVICDKHRTFLHDRCPECGSSINFYRNETSGPREFVTVSVTFCHICRFDLRNATESPLYLPVTPTEVKFTALLLGAIRTGLAQVNETQVTYSHLYFSVLRQLMKIAAMRDKRVDSLRHELGEKYGIAIYSPPTSRVHADVQELGIQARRQLLGVAYCLLEKWPHRFVELSRKHKIWSSIWLRHLDPPARAHALPVPFWFWSVVHDQLYRAKYCPSDKEMDTAIKYLRKNGKVVNKSALAQLLGISVVRRRRHVVL
jgi:hypothetical protein